MFGYTQFTVYAHTILTQDAYSGVKKNNVLLLYISHSLGMFIYYLLLDLSNHKLCDQIEKNTTP